MERHEQCRLEEWKVDLPTIGAIYPIAEVFSLMGGRKQLFSRVDLGVPLELKDGPPNGTG